MKQIFTLSVVLLICSSGFAAPTVPAASTSNLPINAGIVLLLAIGMGIGIKVIAKKLKQVDQHLQDAFGEKVL